MVKYVKIHIFSHFTWLSQKKTVGDGEKLLTHLNSALKALLGFDIFPRVPKKKKVKFCCLVLSIEAVTLQSNGMLKEWLLIRLLVVKDTEEKTKTKVSSN